MEARPQGISPKPPAPPTRRFRVLVVDDDADSLDLLTRWLSMEGYDTLRARNGTEALQRIEADRPDLILLDLIIPPPDGIGVLPVKRSFPVSKPMNWFGCTPVATNQT